MVQNVSSYLKYQLEPGFIKERGKKCGTSPKWGRNSRERRSRREVLSIVLLSHDFPNHKIKLFFYFSAELNGVVSDDDR